MQRPTPVTEPCTGAIPETIIEENEAYQRRLSKENAGNMESKVHEVTVETEEKLITISDEVVSSPVYLPSYNSIDKYEDQSKFKASDFLLDDSPIPIPTLEREPVSRYRNQPQEEQFIFSTDDIELEPMRAQYSDQTERETQKHNTVIGNSKIKPNTPAFDRAIGFLLETKNEKRPKVIKRVKFT